MKNESALEAVKGPRASGAARFWVPFAALALLFTALAIAYAADDSASAPGTLMRGPTDAEGPSHGLEPAPAHS
jgi:hypothetical protein